MHAFLIGSCGFPWCAHRNSTHLSPSLFPNSFTVSESLFLVCITILKYMLFQCAVYYYPQVHAVSMRPLQKRYKGQHCEVHTSARPGAQLGIFRGRGPNQKKGIPSFQSSDVIWDVSVCMCVKFSQILISK